MLQYSVATARVQELREAAAARGISAAAVAPASGPHPLRVAIGRRLVRAGLRLAAARG